MKNLAPYRVKQEDGIYVFVPSALFAGLMVGAFGLGCAFLLYSSTSFLRAWFVSGDSGSLWFGSVLLLAAALIGGLGIWAWRTRRTPLVIEREGRVRYGEKELCPAGAVRAIRIAPPRSAEANQCEVYLELDTGTLVSIPSQYFPGFQSPEDARPFANELAEALKVTVTG
jgi:hypothetical protein